MEGVLYLLLVPGNCGGFDDVMDEKEGSWITDSIGGERKDTCAELVLLVG